MPVDMEDLIAKLVHARQGLDAALERRFQPVKVVEPTEDECVDILKGLRDRYEQHHHVKITDEALTAASRLANRYITGRSELIRRRVARATVQSGSRPCQPNWAAAK